MKIFMRKDMVHVGMAGDIIFVDDGYARNFLIPRGFAVEVTAQNEDSFKKRALHVERRKEVVESHTSLLGERIKRTKLVILKKVHDDGKLYGGINARDILDLLSHKGISLNKNQLLLNKMIKSLGVYVVPVQLTSRVKTDLTIEVVAE